MNHEDDLVNHWLNDISSPIWKEQGEVIDGDGWSGQLDAPNPDARNPDPKLAASLLSCMKVGDCVRIVALTCGASNSRFMGMGLVPGAVLQVMDCAVTGVMIVGQQDHRLGLSAEMAQQIQVIPVDQSTNTIQEIDKTQLLNESLTESMAKGGMMQINSEISTVKLRDAAIGSYLKVIGYEPTSRDYKRKLLAMGLTPGVKLRVTRHAPLGDPTEIEVRDFHLSLRKAEADALMVMPISGEQP